MSQNMIFQKLYYLLFIRRSEVTCNQHKLPIIFSKWNRGRSGFFFLFLCADKILPAPKVCLFVRRCHIQYDINCVCLLLRTIIIPTCLQKKGQNKHQRTLFSPFSRTIYFIFLLLFFRRLHDSSTSCVLFSLPREIRSKCLNEIDDFFLTVSLSLFLFLKLWFSITMKKKSLYRPV